MPEAYVARLDEEMAVIRTLGFASLYLTVQELVAWERARGGLVGPGRGSAAGSLVAWAIGITAHDPIESGLLFSRFLSVERRQLPDFDVDFEPEARAAVQERLAEDWGRGRTAAISAWSGMGQEDDPFPKAGVRHALSTRGLPVPAANEAVAALAAGGEEREGALRSTRVADALEDGHRMAEATNAVSRHASAMALVAGALDGTMALIGEEGEAPALQIDHQEAEGLGAAKVDCLGLDTLTMLRRARTLAGVDDEIWDDGVKAEDADAYARIAGGQTVGIFQMEAPGATRMAHDIGIGGFGDLRLLVAINRPGPIDHADEMAQRRRGRMAPEPPHPVLGEVLADTYGIILYQEQAIEAGRRVAGMDAGQADKLRRAISKKKPEEMATMEEAFRRGARETHPGIGQEEVDTIWSAMERQAGYAFNRAHSTCYAAVARACARIRETHPLEYFCALIDTTLASGSYQKEREQQRLERIARAAATEGIRCLPPTPRRPRASCTPGPRAGTLDTPIQVVRGAAKAQAGTWTAGGDDERRKEGTAGLEDMLRRGLPAKVAEAVAALHEGEAAWAMQVEDVLPAREGREAVLRQGRLQTLWDADPECGGIEGDVVRAMAIVEEVEEQKVVLADWRSRLEVVPSLRGSQRRRPRAGEAVVATLASGERVKLTGLARLGEAREGWTAWIGVWMGEGADRATCTEALDAWAECFGPGPDRAEAIWAEGDVQEWRVEAEREALAALRCVLEPWTARCRIRHAPASARG